MHNTVEQFTATANENLLVLHELTTKAHEDAAKLMELNLATTKSLMVESFEYAKAMVAAKDPQASAAIQAGLAKPVSEIATAYTHEFQRIMARSSTEFMKAAQASMVDVQRGITFMMGSVTQNAPSGASFAFDFFKQAMAASQNVFEATQTSARQAITTGKKSSKAA